ncbi:MAG: cellulase family glycosylhydrolase [Clostridia bacterium]|nr:cellulase family glycosylhydrolase [Clostridia bacterium]
MTDSEKILAAGCAAGAAAAAIPAAYALSQNLKRKPLGEHDFIRAENGEFVSECGEKVVFRGINLNDDIMNFEKYDLAPDSNNQQIFASLESRFGRYGARELMKKHYASFISDADLKKIQKLGANCVRVPLQYKLLCRKDNCKGDIDFDKLDGIVEKCRKLGIYVIFDLHCAPGAQNRDSAFAEGEESSFFKSGKEGFEARNAAIRLWTQVAAHFCDEPAVAAYDLLNRPLNKMPQPPESIDILHKFYRRALKAIRTVDARHTVIMQAAYGIETLPDAEKLGGENVAFGLYSHFHTTFETDALMNAINEKKGAIPFIICKVRAEENIDYSLTAFNGNNISWLFGDYKGNGMNFVYSADISPANLDIDKYDEIGEKWSKPVATKNFAENKELTKLLKAKYKDNQPSIPEKAEKSKPKISVKFGKTTIIGTRKKLPER